MAQHTILVEFYWLSNVMDILSCTTDDKIKEKCFVVSKFDTLEQALDAYEQSEAVWSVIIDDDQDVNKFVDEAYDHLKNNDYRWLCKHFV